MNIKDILSKINVIKKATNFECLILLILTKKLFKYAKELLKGNFMVCALKLIIMVFIFSLDIGQYRAFLILFPNY